MERYFREGQDYQSCSAIEEEEEKKNSFKQFLVQNYF